LLPGYPPIPGAVGVVTVHRIDLTDDEHEAVAKALRKLIDEDRFPLSPRLRPLKSALAKLAPQSAKKPLQPPPKPGRAIRGNGSTHWPFFKGRGAQKDGVPT
jgi:hypothetical protein